VVSQSGGDVQILGEPGEGTTIRIELAACDEALLELTDVNQQAGDMQGESPLRLLVVDDDAAVRAAIVAPLEEAGHVVDSMASPAAALAAIRDEPFDLVITDYAMPHMTGAELIQQALALRPDARFLIVTGYSDSDAVASASPETPLLSKPFTPEELVMAVERAIARGGGEPIRREA
jgi:DNA-binding NtrC family response regulator